MIDNIDIAVAKREIEMASILNPGPWVAHSYNVGLAAKYIAEACGMLNADKAYIYGLLHDIGRRNGISALKHTIDGYDYAMSKAGKKLQKYVSLIHFP